VPLSKPAAASFALWLSIELPGVFDSFVARLPGAKSVGLGFLGDDGDDDDIDDTTSDTNDYEDDTGQLYDVDTLATYTGTDDDALNEDLRELTGDTYSTSELSATGAANTGNIGPVEGSMADTVTGPSVNPVTDIDTSSVDAALQAPPTGIDPIQSISSSSAVAAIGSSAVGAAASALTSNSGLSALGNAASAYFNSQAAQGAQQTALQEQENNLAAQVELASLGKSATGTTYVTNPATGTPEEVLANPSTGQPLTTSTGAYIPAATGEGILSDLTSAGDLGPILLIGGLGVLLLLVFDHGGSSSTESSPRRGRSGL
jgi:hypothetical protein